MLKNVKLASKQKRKFRNFPERFGQTLTHQKTDSSPGNSEQCPSGQEGEINSFDKLVSVEDNEIYNVVDKPNDVAQQTQLRKKTYRTQEECSGIILTFAQTSRKSLLSFQDEDTL